MLLIFNLFLCVMVIFLYLCFALLKNKRKRENIILQKMERFLLNLVSEYTKSEDIHKALEDAVVPFSKDLRKEIQRLNDACRSESFSDEATYYIKTAKNSYLALLFSLCSTIKAYGDKQINGVSLFAVNLRYIKEEIRMALLRYKDNYFAFVGLLELSALPFLFTPLIEKWAMGIDTDMKIYYTGERGFLSLVICFAISVFCMVLSYELQYPTMPGLKKKSITDALFKNAMISSLIDAYVNKNYSRCLKKNKELKQLGEYMNIKEFLLKRVVYSLFGCMIVVILWIMYLIIVGTNGMVFIVPSIIVSGIVGYLLPEFILRVFKSRAVTKKMEEVILFETLIMIVKNYGRITVEEILHWMEHFSIMFREPLEKALDEYPQNRLNSLVNLKEELSFEPADRLVDSMISCDEISISKAFYDLDGEREYDLSQYKTVLTTEAGEKAALAKFLAFIPFSAVLALRLIIPFVMDGFTKMNM